MRKSLILAWLLVPILVLAWHYGPGQASLARDRAGDAIRAAARAEAAGDWVRAEALYAAAIDALPEESTAARRRLGTAQAHAKIWSGDMIGGQEQLAEQIAAMEDDETADTSLLAATRHELATSSYYCAWLMRLEGASAEEWKPEAERARQQFRLLAERDPSAGAEEIERYKKNLENTIRLEQMDLATLLAKPLPKNCPNCCKNLSQKKRKQCQGRCKGKGKKKGDGKEKKKDVRKQIKSAGLAKHEEGGS